MHISTGIFLSETEHDKFDDNIYVPYYNVQLAAIKFGICFLYFQGESL